GKSLEYFDEGAKQRYLPHVIEPSLGVDRTFLAVLCAAYQIDEVDGEKRTVMKFHPRVAPIKASVLPLVKNKPELVQKAQELYALLQRKWNVAYDQSGAIGRRYRRADEAGVPFALTVDFETLEGDGSITLRDRDSTKQDRMSIDEAFAYLDEQINPYK
ncbi:MAG: His/Gly/Thr/Pro-type tRNA ligase C-terminal domain-containing protein, partial [Opitutae bacterium]